MKQRTCTGRLSLLSALLSAAVVIALSLTAAAQTNPGEQPADATVKVELSGAPAPVSDYVSIHVDGGTLRQVLNAFSMQTQRNVVIGPEVVSENVSIHLNNVRWDEALDVILKPYGFGYRKVGDTVVVSKLDKLADLAEVELLETKVFNLKYLDAGDVQQIIKGQLSKRGTSSVVAVQGQTGWDFSTMAAKDSDAAVSFGKLKRQGANAKAQGAGTQGKSKTLIVTDVPGSLARVTAMLAEVDVMQKQVLVESRIMEVNAALVKDAGLDFKRMTFDMSGNAAGQSIGGGSSDPFSLGVNDFNAAAYAGSMKAVAVINFLEQDDDTKVLSAPRILALNNQEATILVGQKFPIIKTEINEGTGNTPTKSTELDYYENSGIQLNVVPQICDDGYINMIVHPTVSTFIGFESVIDQGESLVRYPIIDVREAETQILLKTGETGVIGGLLQDRTKAGIQKIPVLGDIPLIGRMFRNETADNQTIDLLIFLTATIVDDQNYGTIIAKEGEAELPGKPADEPAALPEDIPPAAVIKESAAEVPVAEIVAELEASAPKTNP
jgi:type IV pilus assembly protein PilQ